MPIDHVFTQVHHFKWDSTCMQRIREVVDTREDYSWHWEYEKMYDAIKEQKDRIDIKKSEFYIEKLNNFSYIDYTDYPHWDKLTEIIVKI